jgi:hypothetical protein
MAVDTASCTPQITAAAEVEAPKPTVTRILNHHLTDFLLSNPNYSSITITPLVNV